MIVTEPANSTCGGVGAGFDPGLGAFKIPSICSVLHRPASIYVNWENPGDAHSNPPFFQFQLIRNIQRQSFNSVGSVAVALPGNGLISLPSVRPMKPLAPRNLERPNMRTYWSFQRLLSLDNRAQFLLTPCAVQRSIQDK